MEPREDIQHIEEVLKGNMSAYAVLVDRYQDMIFTIAMKIMQNREDAEEVAQDTFVKAYKKLSAFRQESRFSTWLYRIAYNEAISRKRLKKLPEVELNEEVTGSVPENEIEEEVKGLDRYEQRRAVDLVLKKLPERDRLMIRLYYNEGIRVSEISEIMEMSESNVKVRLHRLRKKIYEELNEILSKKAYSF
jgi:RNA polymerase sigma-70 factor (ECF subfamily)